MPTSTRASRSWRRLSPDEKEARVRKSYDTYAARYPERVALQERTRSAIAAGEIQPQPCDSCGGEARPLYDYEALQVAGWRCPACRKAARP